MERLAGGLRRFLHPALQGVHLFLEMFDLLMQALDVILDGRRGQLPVHWAKGKRPQNRVGRRLRRGLYHESSRRCGVSYVRLIGILSSKL
jgi:hypothetical protein